MVTRGQISATKECLPDPFGRLTESGHVRTIGEVAANWLLSHSYRSVAAARQPLARIPYSDCARSALAEESAGQEQAFREVHGKDG